MTDNKFCKVCGHEYVDGAGQKEIMKHIQDAHMGEDAK